MRCVDLPTWNAELTLLVFFKRVLDCIIGGQILSSAADGSMSVVVGIIIVGLISCIVAVFGMSIFYWYQRFVV